MKPKHSLSILATSALIGLAGFALAQDSQDANLDTDARAQPGAVANVDTARKLYAWGVANDSAIAVVAAAEMMASIELTDTEREVVQTAIEGADTTQDGTGVDLPVADFAAMLDKARELAAGDPELLALIEDVAAAGTRGRIGGATRTLSRLAAGFQDSWRIPYYGSRLAELAIIGDGDSDLDLLITDEKGNRICYDTSRSDQLYCSWTPRVDGYFLVTVKNVGRVRNSYYILTN